MIHDRRLAVTAANRANPATVPHRCMAAEPMEHRSLTVRVDAWARRRRIYPAVTVSTMMPASDAGLNAANVCHASMVWCHVHRPSVSSMSFIVRPFR